MSWRRVEHVNNTTSAYSYSHHISSHNTDTSSLQTKTLSITPILNTLLSKQHNTLLLIYYLTHWPVGLSSIINYSYLQNLYSSINYITQSTGDTYDQERIIVCTLHTLWTVKQMPHKALSSTLNDKTRTSLTQLGRIQITIFLLKRLTIKHKIANCLYVHGIWVTN